MIKAAFLCNSRNDIDYVYGLGRRERLASMVDLYPELITEQNLQEHLPYLEACEAIFSTWGMPGLPGETVDRMKNLRAVFYAAGSVQLFARPFLERGIAVVSAWAANGRPVAAFTLAQVLLSCKGYFRNIAACRDPRKRMEWTAPLGPGILGAKVAIIGAGEIGRQLIELLRPFGVEMLVVDPYLPAESARMLGVTLVSLQDAFSTALVVSNHVPNLPETRGMFGADLLRSMIEGATFVNTGRGAQVVEDDMTSVAAERPDLTFLLDVTDPEPPVETSPLYALPNVHMSSHIAGALGTEVVTMADSMMEELSRYLSGEPFRYAVTLKMLDTMA